MLVGPRVNNNLQSRVVQIVRFRSDLLGKLTLNRLAKAERIAFVIGDTTTHWDVINDIALCITTADSRTRINALIITTCFVELTV